MKSLLKNRLIILGLIAIYRILLDYVYLNFTNAAWSYDGFECHETASSLFTSWFVLLVLSVLILPYFKSNEPFLSDLLILVFVMRVVPFTTMIRFLDTPDKLSVLFLVYFALIYIFTRVLKIKPVPLSNSIFSRSNDFLLYAGLFFFAAVIIFISGYYANFRFHLSLADVYDMRHEAREFEIPILMRYAWSPASNILPLLFVYFLQKKKKAICLFIIFIILLNFSINGMKSTIFKLLICVTFTFVKFKDLKPLYLPTFIGLLLITISEKSLWDFQFIHDIVIRRVLFIPPLLDTYYFDYISQNGPMFYMRGGTPIQYIIGDLYYNAPNMDCNNGLFSDAFMNLGQIGCFVYPFIYAILFRLCSSAFRGADKGLIVFAAIIMSYTLEGSELTTGLLTHGLFLFGFFLYLISVKTSSRTRCINEKSLLHISTSDSSRSM